MDQHDHDLLLLKKTFLSDAYMNLEQHFQQLNADLINSCGENERDMFDQRNQQYQTIILSSSVMFSALSTVIIQGFLPPTSGSTAFILYALSSSISLGSLFLCIIICIEIVHRASKFMYRRANNQTLQLRDALALSNSMLEEMRGSLNDGNISLRRSIMDPLTDIDKAWTQHEKIVHKFLHKRDQINNKAAPIRLDDATTANQWKETFEDFWVRDCKGLGNKAIGLFYVGSLSLISAIMIYMWTVFKISYGSSPGAVIAVCIICVSIVIGIGALVAFRCQEGGSGYISVEEDDPEAIFSSPHIAEIFTEQRLDGTQSAIVSSSSSDEEEKEGEFRNEYFDRI